MMGIAEQIEGYLNFKSRRQTQFVHAHVINEHKARTNLRINVQQRQAAAVSIKFIRSQALVQGT
jgi:hypothetical protein